MDRYERGTLWRRGPVRTMGWPFRNVAIVGLVLGSAGLAGCAPPAYLFAGADPADPTVPVTAVGYRSTVEPYVSLRPTTPKAWREQNKQVAPAPKSGR